MRFRANKRIGVTALAGAVVAVLVTALPASAAAPTIGSLSPATGPPGTAVVVTGTNFQNPNITSVTVGGISTPFTITSGTTLSTSVPCGLAAGNANVVVANGDNPPGSMAFAVTAATAPVVSSFSPASGVTGTVVTITGTNFCNATQVRFNNTVATSVSVNSASQITATVPTGATSGKISVTTALGTGTSAANFVIGPPVITSFTPTIGLPGSTVTITGSNFTGATAVRFNGLTATFTVVSDTQITTVVPSSATTGPITVTNAVGTATGATFTVGEPTHDRSVTFAFGNNSRVTGEVNVGDGFVACYSLVPVVIQKQGGGGWKWVDTTATTKSGSFKTYIPPSSGTFRAKVNKQTLADGSSCAGDASPTRHHNA